MKRMPRPTGREAGQAATRRARRWARLRPWLIPAVLLLCVTLPHLGDGDWQRGDSGWYTAIGVQAWRTGELWTLMGEPGQPYFNKPPLVFWITGFVAWIFGPSAWAARLPTVAAALGCVLATVGITRVFATRRTALTVGVVLALSVEFFRRTREVSLDLWQLVFLLLALWIAAGAVKDQRWRRLALAGLPIGLALMCKPMVALLGPVAIAVWIVAIGEARRLGWVALMVGAALVIAGPWHLAMALEHGGAFMRTYIGAEIAGRAGGGVTTDTTPAFYLVQLGKTYWPWLLFVVLAVVTWARGKDLGRDGRAFGLAAMWTLVWLAALSAFPDRRDRYALVLLPSLAMLAGLWLARWPWAWLRVLSARAMRFGVPIACAGAVAFALLPVRVQRPIDPQWPALFAWMQREGVTELWQGGFYGYHGSRLYLQTGSWPITTRDRWGAAPATPPEGAMIIYHERDGLVPGVNESVLFQSGSLTVTRLIGSRWSPGVVADPGER